MKVHRRWSVPLALACLGIRCGLLSAQESPVLAAPLRLQPEWGTQTLGVRTIHGTGFQPADSSTSYSSTSNYHRIHTGGGGFFGAALPDLPAGALITGLELEACDTNATWRVIVYLASRQSPSVPRSSSEPLILERRKPRAAASSAPSTI